MTPNENTKSCATGSRGLLQAKGSMLRASWKVLRSGTHIPIFLIREKLASD
jgi:hypothetical protein